MAHSDLDPSTTNNGQCKRCKEHSASLYIRADDVCKKCFAQYMTTKAVKRMETYRVRGSTKSSKRLLLPLSFGVSSASLLYILDQHLQGQFDRMRRAAYELIVVHVDVLLNDDHQKETADILDRFKECFPRHTYLRLGLEQALYLDGINWISLGLPAAPIVTLETDGTRKLRQMITSMPSSTSRSDLASILLTRLLVDIAKKHQCEAILFGDSTTRLAERTLSETAKGRGFSLPWQVSDGMSPSGIIFNYPLRDLLKKELVTFSTIPGNLTSDLIVHQLSSSRLSASSKSTTIDDLMAEYFESVEQNYPSIVANVVRTSSKLKSLSENDHKRCGLCGVPVQEEGANGWAGDQNSATEMSPENAGLLCYGCRRLIDGQC